MNISYNTVMPPDPHLIDQIVNEVKSQGIFDKCRKECISDVDTKPAYQNLRARVENSVNSFLDKRTWRPDSNKTQLRESLRKHINDATYLDAGVERIVDQVVNPKIYSIFKPQIEDVVYKFLGFEKPEPVKKGEPCHLKDLLPTDLDPVSPESDKVSLKESNSDTVRQNADQIFNENEPKETDTHHYEENIHFDVQTESNGFSYSEDNKNNLFGIQEEVNEETHENLNISLRSGEKTEEEEESPVFEPIDTIMNDSIMSNDSHLSGISELTNHNRTPPYANDYSQDNYDYNQDSQMSKASSNSRLSIVTNISASNPESTPITNNKDESNSNHKGRFDYDSPKDSFKDIENFEINRVIENNSKNEKDRGKISEVDIENKINDFTKENSHDAVDYNIEDKGIIRSSTEKQDSSSSSFIDKTHSNRDKDKESDRERNKDKRRSSDKNSRKESSKSTDKYDSSHNKTKSRRVSDSKENKDKKSHHSRKKDEPNKEKDLKEKNLYKVRIRELLEKKELTEKENSEKHKDSRRSRDKDRKDSSSRNKDHRSSHKSSRSQSSSHSSRNSRTSDKKRDSKDRRSRNDSRDHKSSRSKDRRSSPKTRSDSDKRESRSSFKDKKHHYKKTKSIDDHSSLRKNSRDRRSTDRDDSNGPNRDSYRNDTNSHNPGSSKKVITYDDSKCNDIINKNPSSSNGTNQSISCLDKDNKEINLHPSEICLPIKKRPLPQDEIPNSTEPNSKKRRSDAEKMQTNHILDNEDVSAVPDEERVQIIEICSHNNDEEYEEPYPENQYKYSIEESAKILQGEMMIVDSQLPIEGISQLDTKEISQSNEPTSFKVSEEISEANVLSKIISCENKDLNEYIQRENNHDCDAEKSDSLANKSGIENSITQELENKQLYDSIFESDNKNSEANISQESSNVNYLNETVLSIEEMVGQMDALEKPRDIPTNPDSNVNIINQENVSSLIPQMEERNILEDLEDKKICEEVNEESSEIQNCHAENQEIFKRTNLIFDEHCSEITSSPINKDEEDKEFKDPKTTAAKHSHSIEETKTSTNESDNVIKPIVCEENILSEGIEERSVLKLNIEGIVEGDCEPKIEIEMKGNQSADKLDEEETPCEVLTMKKQIFVTPGLYTQESNLEFLADKNSNDSNDVLMNETNIDTYSVHKQLQNIKSENPNEIGSKNQTNNDIESTTDSKIDDIIGEIDAIVGNDVRKEDSIIQQTDENEYITSDNLSPDNVKTSKNNPMSGDEEMHRMIQNLDAVIKKEVMEDLEEVRYFSPSPTSEYTQEGHFDDHLETTETNELQTSPMPSQTVDNQIETLNEENVDLVKNFMKEEQHSPELIQVCNTELNTLNEIPEDSDDEGDCRYFEFDSNDQEYYMKLKAIVETLEQEERSYLEPVEEHDEEEVLPSTSMHQPESHLLSAKRSVSPQVSTDYNPDNNNERIVKEDPKDQVSELTQPIKRRKVGKLKKTSGSVIAMQSINTETSEAPASPQSDVSANSDKIPGSLDRRPKNTQRYSSDDLYKPRPRFASSSRRKRPSDQS